MNRPEQSDTYPYAVIGGLDEAGTIFYIANLVTNERTQVWFESSYVAHTVAKSIKRGIDTFTFIPWTHGRE